MSGQDLLDASFVRELGLLRRRLKVEVRSGGTGEHVARRRGGSAEFQEHRPYEPGDDLRRIDWLAFARSGLPVVKTFRAEEDVVVRLLVDASASLDFGNPRKIEVSRRLAAALAYLALSDSERVQLLVTGDAQTRGLSSVGEPRRGRGALHRVLSELSQIEPRGRGSLAAALRSLSERALRPGLLVVLSDFFDAGPVVEELGRLRAQGHSLALVQVLSRMELEPDFQEQDLALVDAETEAELTVTMDASAIEAYLARLAGLVEELRATSRRLGGRYVRALSDEPLEQPVRRIVLGPSD